MKNLTLAAGIVALLFTAASTAAAQGKGHGGGPKPKPSSSARAVPVQSQGPKVKTNGGGKVQGAPKTTGQRAKTTGQTAKVTGSGKVKTQTAESVTATRVVSAERANKKTTSTQISTSGTLTPVQAKLDRNSNLAAKLRSRLPAGTDMMVAADGFRNLGQFVAAVNVSNNLNIPFADLKARMVNDGMSLGQAIQSERSGLDGTALARRAESDATLLISQTTSSKGKKN
jgi:hypothetical protein